MLKRLLWFSSLSILNSHFCEGVSRAGRRQRWQTWPPASFTYAWHRTSFSYAWHRTSFTYAWDPASLTYAWHRASFTYAWDPASVGSFTSHKSMTPPTVAQCSANWANRSTAVFMSAPLKQLLTGTEMLMFGTSNESRLVKLPTQNYTASPLFVVRYICKALRFHGGQTLEL